VKVIGLTGGAGAGKSAVAGLLEAKGILYLDADRFAREAVAPGTPALREIVEFFGADMLLPDGALDRERMAERVFSDPAAREKLEAITHPRILAMIGEELEKARASGRYPAAVVEAPLLFESGCVDMMDEIWAVDATEDRQIARMMRRGLTADMARDRLRAQMDPEERQDRADILIENNGSLDDLSKAVDEAWADAQARWSHGEA
jgi:dephospho-CoA kinase